jgi:regulatory protein
MSLTIRSSALNLLASREHTKLELQRKLIAKGFAANEIATVVQELEKQGLQSDKRFVESYVAMRLRRGFGSIRIKAELCERGVDPELIEQFLSGYKSIWVELAQSVRSKKFGCEIPTSMSEQAKQMRYLYYKGFDADLVRKILNSKL